MKLETFFEKFNELADAPDAVGKIRELILDFAIGGRLLRTLERADLNASGGWPKQTLGSIASLITKGSTPTSYGHQYEASGIPFVKVENIADGVINRSSMEQFISEATHEFLKRSQLESGDILFSIAGTIGKTCIVSSRDVPANTNQALAIIRGFTASFEIPFLKMQLDSFVANKVKAKARGGAMPNISLGDLRDLLVVVPPITEQKRIVAKVDELMALCDRLEAQQQERETRHAALSRASLARFADAPTPANLNLIFHKSFDIAPADLRKTILTLAVQGKLVPQNPNDEPAEEFLEVIAQRLSQSKGKRSKNNGAAAADDTKPFDLPSGWAWSRFPNLGEFGRGKSKHRPRNDPSLFVNGHHRLVQTGDVARANGTIDTHSGLYNNVGLAQSKLWPAGTLCITIAANIADSGILGFDACFPDSVVGFIPASPIPSVHYFEYFMRTAKEHLERFAPSTAQKNINLGILEQVWIPIPPLAEQRRIVAKVEHLMALVDALETQLVASREKGQKLLEAVVSELTLAS
jgi:type I restriction enzyme S subunit